MRNLDEWLLLDCEVDAHEYIHHTSLSCDHLGRRFQLTHVRAPSRFYDKLVGIEFYPDEINLVFEKTGLYTTRQLEV